MNALLERITINPEVCGGKPCIKAPASGFRSFLISWRAA